MNSKAKIIFKDDTANLYDIGYILTDIYQTISLAHLIEEADFEVVEKKYGADAKGLNRYSAYNEKIAKSSEIMEVKNGSVELIIPLAGLVVSILSPFLGALVGQKLRERNEQVSFEINPDNQLLKDIMDNYQLGQYGRGIDGLNQLMDVLSDNDFNVNMLRQNAFVIHNALDRSTNRIVRTIRKNRR